MDYSCESEPNSNIILGVLLCIGGIVSYIPQIYSLVKTKQSKGISEMSLLILCVGSSMLTGNTVILNWWKFDCYNYCTFWICTGRLLSLVQICISWFMVIPLYLIFLRYKIKESDRRAIYDLKYIFIYVVSLLLIIIIGIYEKKSNNNTFFQISGRVLGILSAACSCIVWLPQIVELISSKEPGNLSLLMFIMQSPGNIVIILLQILYKQNWTTWVTYVVTFIEQTIIVILLLIYKYKTYNNINNEITNTEITNTDIEKGLLDYIDLET